MQLADALTQYPELTCFERTMTLDEANIRGRSCRKSAVYAHYCRRAAIEPYVISAGAESSLAQAFSIQNGELWTCVYVGEVAISTKKRKPSRRFYHEFGGGGYLGQAPALEGLCSVLYRLNCWTPYHTNLGFKGSKLRVYLLPNHREQFASWRRENVRVAWQEFADPVETAKGTVVRVESNLLLALRPLLNIKKGTNAFRATAKRLRAELRQDSLKQFHPKPLG